MKIVIEEQLLNTVLSTELIEEIFYHEKIWPVPGPKTLI